MYLNGHSFYSLRFGVLSIKQLLELTVKYGYTHLAITDINSTSACIDFIRLSKSYHINPILGVDIRIGIQQKHVILAKNNQGFQELNTYLTAYLLAKSDEEKSDLIDHHKLENCIIIYPFATEKNKINLLPSNAYIGLNYKDIQALRLNKLDTSKMVILQTLSFTNNRSHNVHKLLRAIDKNTLLSQLKPTDFSLKHAPIIGLTDLLEQFKDYPDIIKNTDRIFNNCQATFDLAPHAKNENLKVFGNSEAEDYLHLKTLVYEGIDKRYTEVTDVLLDRIEMELNMIKKKSFVSYFLINWDIISYANQKGYFHVGRGSGANSIIAYLIGITDVDPLDLNLYFERFINLYRASPPDFDLDFSWQDREDVTRYIFEKYPNTALVCTYTTFQYKGIVRELGKVFGLTNEEIEKLGKNFVDFDRLDSVTQQVLKYAGYIKGFPNYLSVHAGGIIIADKPINYFTATFLPPKGYPTLQFDMLVAEDVGLHKFDILSQRGLGKIKDAITIIKENQNIDVFNTVHDIPKLKADPEINNLIKSAEAIGCFYVESPAMRMLLKKLSVNDYLGLVAASSIIRPGVAKSGMMRAYIERYRFPEKRKDAAPIMLDIMPDTFGIMVYQEDVLKVANLFGGLDLGEADVLRRGMAGKFKSRDTFQTVKVKFFENAAHKGYELTLIEEVWRQIESFAGYAFAKGHSASYAIESYQTLFLKCYYPLEYMVATINNGGGFYSRELYFLEAKKQGAIIHPPCINNSDYKTKIIGIDIYIGLEFLHAFESKSIIKTLHERAVNGPFLSFDDFINRVNLSVEQAAILIKINAFRFTQINKRDLLWQVHLKKATLISKKDTDLFKISPKDYQLPTLDNSWQSDAFDQIELIGFSMCSFFNLLTKQNTNELLAKDLRQYIDKEVWVKGYLITVKKTRTSNGKHMIFGTFLDRNLDWIDTVHFPDIAHKYRLKGKGIYAIKGKVKIDFNCVSIEVVRLEKLAVIEDPRYVNTIKQVS